MEITQVLGVDKSTAFTDTQLDELEKLGVKAIGFYIGGPYYSINGWSKADVDRTLAKGFAMIPIYVGQNVVKGGKAPVLTAAQGSIDGTAAVGHLIDFGFKDVVGLPIVLDVERVTWDTYPEETAVYAYHWILAVRQYQIKDGIYGSVGIFDRLITDHEPPHWAWLADWVRTAIDNKLELANLPGFPPTLFSDHQRAWQYAGNVVLPTVGVAVDIDLFDSALTITKATAVDAEVPPTATATGVDSTPVDVTKQNMITLIDNHVALLQQMKEGLA
jgi:hypothetical protein